MWMVCLSFTHKMKLKAFGKRNKYCAANVMNDRSGFEQAPYPAAIAKSKSRNA